MLKLVIGNKNYSSWSLRPWLLLRVKGIAFEEVRIPLYEAGSPAALRAHSPSGKVPALEDGDTVVWDSLAISEYVAERNPGTGCWPVGGAARAVARSVSAEMHSGFQALREALPMNCRRVHRRETLAPEVRADVERVCAIWRSCRERFGANGAFLFGEFGIADAMYAPVVIRFRNYGIETGATEAHYMTAVFDLPAMRQWFDAAAVEPETIARVEAAT